jgi:hypothetical protein
MKKLLAAVIIIVLITAGLYYWFFLHNTISPTDTPTTGGETFNPFNRSGGTTTNIPSSNVTTGGITSQPVINTDSKIPLLRHLSVTPIGGFMASSTASSTLARYVDRGAGHIFEATSISPDIPKISNTTIPRVYDSFWNKNMTAAVLRYMKEDGSTVINFFGELKRVPFDASSTDLNTMPYEVKGKFLSSTIKEIAVSPKADKIFTYSLEDGKGIGYTSGFDESKKVKVFESPLTQVSIDWPEENTLTLATKPSGVSSGFFYSIDLKKPVLKKLLGALPGLTAKMSADGKKVIYSTGGAQGFKTSLLNTKDLSTQELVIKTIADKCVWSKLHPTEAYCAVPTEFPQGTYPDAWYKGDVAFNDQIWLLDSTTGDVTLVANLLNLSKDLIDVINPILDPKENFLYFMNKRDLTLWSLDLSVQN